MTIKSLKTSFMTILVVGTISSVAWADKLKELVVYTPPIGVGVLMVDAVKSPLVSQYAEKVTVKRWDSPDKMRAGIMDGSIDITFVPSYAGANLYNKGINFQLINVLTGGLLYVISRDHSIKTIDDLRGKTITVPFKNDMPDLVLQTLFKQAGLTIGTDVTVNYVATPNVAVKTALAGQAQTLLLPEIAATKVAVVAKQKQGFDFKSVVDIQSEWGRLMGGKAYIPQAGVAVRKTFVEKNPDLVRDLHKALVQSSKKLQSDKQRLIERTESLWPGQGPIFAKSIAKWNLDVQYSQDMRPELESFYTKLQDLNPKIIGGKLPDGGFYYK